MDAIVDALGQEQAELAGLLAGLDGDDWHQASPCPGWDIADVVLHLAQTNELAIGSASGRFDEALARLASGLGSGRDVDDGAARMVAREREQAPSETRARWRRGADDLLTLLRHADPHRRVEWVAGQLSVHTLTATRLAETWIHTGDVAAALGKTIEPTSRLRHVARLAWRTLPYAFARSNRELAGPVAFELSSPSGDSWDFAPDARPLTVIRGTAVDLCLVAARRVRRDETGLRGTGPDANAVLDLVRTYA